MNRIIAITAGHRGAATGAVGIIDEGAEAIVLRDLILKELSAKGIPTTYDNEKDTLTEVVHKLDIFLSPEDICLDIHFNSYADPSAHGTEVLVPNEHTDMEMSIAQDLLSAVCATLGTHPRGVKTESQSQHTTLKMLSGFDASNLLLEVCFVSNNSDCVTYCRNKNELARAIADVLIKYAKK